MIWLGYFGIKSSDPVDIEYFFFFCDKTCKEVDVDIISDGFEKEVLNTTSSYLSVKEWIEGFGKKDPVIPTHLKKLPTSVKQFKQLCRELMPEVFL